MMPDEDLIERLRAIARQRQQQPLEPFRIPLETHSEWIAADRIATLIKEAADTKRILGDPVTVHLNMLSGTIAKISMENCAHVHGIQFNDLEAAEAALASLKAESERLREALKNILFEDSDKPEQRRIHDRLKARMLVEPLSPKEASSE